MPPAPSTPGGTVASAASYPTTPIGSTLGPLGSGHVNHLMAGSPGPLPGTPASLAVGTGTPMLPGSSTPGALRGTLTPVGLPPRTPPDPGDRPAKRQRHSDNFFHVVRSAVKRGALEEACVLLERYQASLGLDRLDGTRFPTATEQCEAFQILLVSLKEGTLLSPDSARLLKLLMWVSGQGSVLRMQDEQGRTALHVALQFSQHTAAGLLLDWGADTSTRSHEGLLPLHEAVCASTSCSEQLLRRLAGENLTWLSARDGKDRTPLQLAADAGDPATIALLLDLGAEPVVRDSALMHAAVRSMTYNPCSGVLLRGVLAALSGKGLVFLDQPDSRGYTPLSIAFEAERPAVAAALIDLGANVAIRSRSGDLPLHVAAWMDWDWAQLPLVMELLPRLTGREKELIDCQDDEGYTALHLALAYGKADVASHLLDLGACASKHDSKGYLALHLSVWYRRPQRELLQRLLGPGGEHLAACDVEGCTPLHVALKARSIATAATLLELRSDASARDLSGRLPLHFAAGSLETCSTSFIAELCGPRLELIDAQDSQTGRTALHDAACIDNETAVASLLELRCNVTVRDAVGRTALGLALEWGSEATAALLQRQGAEPSGLERGLVTSLMLTSLPAGLRWWETDSLSFLYQSLSLSQKQRLLRDFGEERRALGEHSAERLELVCRRDDPMQELCDQLNADVLAYGDLEVIFRSSSGGREAAVGQGLRQEWYGVVKDELADPNRALLASRDGGKTLDINPHSGLNPDHLEHFRVLGKVLALALAHGENIDGLRLSSPLRKLLLGQELSACDDLGGFDPVWGRVLGEVSSRDVSRWGLRFEADLASMPFDPTGNLRCREERSAEELEPGGREQEVTEANKDRFVKLMREKLVRDYLGGSAAQLQAVREGMEHILGSSHVLRRMRQLLDHADLDLLIGGQARVDVDLFEREVEYAGCTAESEQIGWFWAEVRLLDEDGLSRLLHFVTGSGSVPAGGFAMFSSYGSAHPRVTVAIEDVFRRTCRAATCFNTLYLPRYPSRAALAEGLSLSLGCCAGFQEFEHPGQGDA